MSRFSLVALLAFVGAGCTEPPPAEPFQISIRVESDPGKPMAGASISRANKLLGTTNAEGRVNLKIAGVEGEFTDVTVTCPEGYQMPPKPVSVKLTRIADKTKIPEYLQQCPPAMRRVVVAVRAENGPNLPVMYLDKAVTRTDVGGAASFALEVPPGTNFSVVLNTIERHDIKPINPSRTFVVPSHDEVFLLDQKFEVEKKAPPPKAKVFVPRALGARGGADF
ncbi:MAG: hypothetical protein KIT84_30815 [Labilithrix sp.]|nr:hypothetical protein [Labilithrix sp.]MCW5815460.1 hypothetical protein [Labilithrix sp.]